MILTVKVDVSVPKRSKHEALLMLSATCKQFMEKLKEVSAYKPCVKMSLGPCVFKNAFLNSKHISPFAHIATPPLPQHTNTHTPPGKG